MSMNSISAKASVGRRAAFLRCCYGYVAQGNVTFCFGFVLSCLFSFCFCFFFKELFPVYLALDKKKEGDIGKMLVNMAFTRART